MSWRKAGLAIIAKYPDEQFACTLLLMLGELKLNIGHVLFIDIVGY